MRFWSTCRWYAPVYYLSTLGIVHLSICRITIISCFRQRNRKYILCGNRSLWVGNRWFQVISIAIKAPFSVLFNCCSPFLSEERGGCTEAALDGFSLFYSKTPFFQHFNDTNTTAIFSSILSLFSLVLQLAINWHLWMVFPFFIVKLHFFNILMTQIPQRFFQVYFLYSPWFFNWQSSFKTKTVRYFMIISSFFDKIVSQIRGSLEKN